MQNFLKQRQWESTSKSARTVTLQRHLPPSLLFTLAVQTEQQVLKMSEPIATRSSESLGYESLELLF
jgi:hypothetical protein